MVIPAYIVRTFFPSEAVKILSKKGHAPNFGVEFAGEGRAPTWLADNFAPFSGKWILPLF